MEQNSAVTAEAVRNTGKRADTADGKQEKREHGALSTESEENTNKGDRNYENSSIERKGRNR